MRVRFSYRTTSGLGRKCELAILVSGRSPDNLQALIRAHSFLPSKTPRIIEVDIKAQGEVQSAKHLSPPVILPTRRIDNPARAILMPKLDRAIIQKNNVVG